MTYRIAQVDNETLWFHDSLQTAKYLIEHFGYDLSKLLDVIKIVESVPINKYITLEGLEMIIECY